MNEPLRLSNFQNFGERQLEVEAGPRESQAEAPCDCPWPWWWLLLAAAAGGGLGYYAGRKGSTAESAERFYDEL